jgi:hypothetical protein
MPLPGFYWPMLALTLPALLPRADADRNARAAAAPVDLRHAPPPVRPADRGRRAEEVALIARARKLLTILNAMMRNNIRWPSRETDFHYSC